MQLFTSVKVILESYSFTFEGISDRLLCVICKSILKKAKQTRCGCKVCENCIKEYLMDGPKKCPNDLEDCEKLICTIDDVIFDNATNKEISSLKCHCPFEQCKVFVSLKEMIEHIEECEFREINCSKCRAHFTRTLQKDHDENICEMRVIKCHHCNKEMTHRDLYNIHLNTDSKDMCDKYEGICPNNCGEIRKINLKEHAKDCKNKKLECPFNDFGCLESKMEKNDMVKHMRENDINHFKILLDEMCRLKQEVIHLRKELNEAKKVIADQGSIMNKTTENCLALRHFMEDAKKDSIPRIPVIQLANIIFRNLSYIWRVENFNQKKNDARTGTNVSLLSDPFYTSDFGYKICMKIYPDGDGTGKGTHLSVFFTIMKGDYDELLSWPFRQKVSIYILDQLGNSNHYSDTFKPDPKSICYGKPTDVYNLASGAPRFIAFGKLEGNSKYCVNDTIFLKISVDPIGLTKP